MADDTGSIARPYIILRTFLFLLRVYLIVYCLTCFLPLLLRHVIPLGVMCCLCLCLLPVSVLYVFAVVAVCLFLFSVIVRGIVCQLLFFGSLRKRACLFGFPGARKGGGSELLLVCLRQVVRT